MEELIIDVLLNGNGTGTPKFSHVVVFPRQQQIPERSITIWGSWRSITWSISQRNQASIFLQEFTCLENLSSDRQQMREEKLYKHGFYRNWLFGCRSATFPLLFPTFRHVLKQPVELIGPSNRPPYWSFKLESQKENMNFGKCSAPIEQETELSLNNTGIVQQSRSSMK